MLLTWVRFRCKFVGKVGQFSVQLNKRLLNDSAPKYATSARSVLQKRIAELEAKNLSLQEELEKVRAQQFDELDVFLIRPRNLQDLIDIETTGS